MLNTAVLHTAGSEALPAAGAGNGWPSPSISSPAFTSHGYLLNTLRTGDVVLFSGRGLVSGTIRWFTRSCWSHVGLVLRVPRLSPLPLLLEATSLGETPDIHAGRTVAGVGLVRLEEKLRAYDGNVALRRLRLARSAGDRLQWRAELLAREWHLQPYENFVLSRWRDRLAGGSARRGSSGLFCSELVARAFQELGLLDTAIHARAYLPRHFDPLHALPWIDADLAPLETLKNSCDGNEDSAGKRVTVRPAMAANNGAIVAARTPA